MKGEGEGEKGGGGERQRGEVVVVVVRREGDVGGGGGWQRVWWWWEGEVLTIQLAVADAGSMSMDMVRNLKVEVVKREEVVVWQEEDEVELVSEGDK